MPAIVIAGLVRLPKNRNVRYRQPDRCDCQSVRLCKYETIHTYLKVCVQNVLHVLECKLEDVDGGRHCLTASLLTGCWNCSHSWTGVTSTGQRHESGSLFTNAGRTYDTIAVVRCPSQLRSDLSWIGPQATIHAPADYSKSCSLTAWDQDF